MASDKLHIAKVVLTNVCRFFLAGMFIFSGFVKAIDPLGSMYKIQDYLEAFGLLSWMPSFFPLLFALILSTLEFFVGVTILFGIRKGVSTVLALVFMAFMTPLTLYLAIANPVSDCGCFGDAWVLTNWETFFKNIFLLFSAIILNKYRGLIIRFVSLKSEWLISLYTVLFIFLLSLYCLARLPIMDFRPYRIGTNIPEAMSIPPDAERSVYETVFVLDKEGRREEFTIDNYPDSTWTFVDTRTILIKKGYEPPIQQFSMIDVETGEDIADSVLADDNYTFLLIAHRIEEADDSYIDLINEIYDYSVEYGYAFYCLTSSPDAEIEQWKDRTGAEYRFCLADDTELRTIVRANPGLLLIKSGTILNKWSGRRLPDEYVLNDTLDHLEHGKLQAVNDLHTILYVLLWFVGPLLLIFALDFSWVQWNARKDKIKKTN